MTQYISKHFIQCQRTSKVSAQIIWQKVEEKSIHSWLGSHSIAGNAPMKFSI